MNELMLKLDCHFTDEDREKSKLIVDKIINLAGRIRQVGLISAIEHRLELEKNDFLKIAINLICDGTEEAAAKEILVNIILTGGYSGSELLSRLIIIEGIMAIYCGENPRQIEIKLLSMLGEKYVAEKLFEAK